MDIATLVGLLVVFVAIFFGGGMAAQPEIFINIPSLATVIGGLIGATMIGNPMANLARIVPVYLNAIKVSLTPPFEIIETIVGFAETARREGILALESAAADAGDEFLSSGIRLAVDGTEPDLIEEILETELMYLEERHKEGADIISTMATMAPAYGMIGTLIGLVLMLANMEDPSQIGAGMAIALLTTLYGSILANMLLDPVAAKLKTYSKQEVLVRKIIIQGIMSIQSGDNPRVVETKLSVMLPPSDRPDPDAGEAAE
tara:strand:+ start:1828 stop:2607 length:780 start_codon:yes stop_codon:yes gene_type:complete